VVAKEQSYADSIPAAGMEQVADRSNDPMSIENVRAGVLTNGVLTNLSANFEQDDLDVPAFLRKRSEVM
jgi:hypothetical protein